MMQNIRNEKPDGNDDITAEMHDIMESFNMSKQQEYVYYEAAYRHQKILFHRATDTNIVTLGEVLTELFEGITRDTILSMAVTYHNVFGFTDYSKEDMTIIDDQDKIWNFNLLSCILKKKTEDGHYTQEEAHETVLTVRSTHRNVMLALTGLGGNLELKYMRVTVLAPDNSENDNCEPSKDSDSHKSKNAPFITSFILSYIEEGSSHNLEFYESLELSMERKKKSGEPMDCFEDMIRHGRHEFQPGAYWESGFTSLEEKKYYDSFIYLEREFNYLRYFHAKENESTMQAYYLICNKIGHCLINMGRAEEAAFFYKSGEKGLKTEHPCYLALCKAKLGNPIAMKELDHWMNVCLAVSERTDNLTEEQERSRDDVAKELESYHLKMERYLNSSPKYSGTVTLGFVLDIFLGIKQKNIYSQLSVYDLKSNRFLKKIEKPEDIYAYALNVKEAEDKVFVFACSHASLFNKDKEDRSNFCASAPVVIATHSIKPEQGKATMRVDIIRCNFVLDDRKRTCTVVNMPMNTSFVLGEDVEYDFDTTDSSLTLADSKIEELLGEKRFVEAMKLGKWIFECRSHKMKAKTGKEYLFDDKNLAHLFYHSAYNVGYCMMRLGLLTRAAYYLEIARLSRYVRHVQEYIQCLTITNDPDTLQVVERTIKDSPKPNNKELMPAWNAHMAFLKKRKAYLLIEKKRYEEARDLLLELMNDPKSKDFALNELGYIDQILRKQ